MELWASNSKKIKSKQNEKKKQKRNKTLNKLQNKQHNLSACHCFDEIALICEEKRDLNESLLKSSRKSLI